MDIFSDNAKAVLIAVMGLLFLLSRLAVRFPATGWLQIFRLPERQMSEAEKLRHKRAGNRLAGAELVLAGLVLPVLYLGLKLMFFSEPQLIPMIIVGACSLACISAGVWVLVRNS